MSPHTACLPTEELSLFLSGRLSTANAEAVREHLTKCDVCREAVRRLEGGGTVALATAPPEARHEFPTESLADSGVSATPVSSSAPRAIDSAATPDATGLDTRDYYFAPGSPAHIDRLGSFRIRKIIGRGGMGVVFEAEDSQLERVVALKVLAPALAADESARQRFLREARSAAQLKHDHVVTIHQVGEDQGIPYLAMEYLAGQSLHQRLREGVPVPVAETLRIGREIAEGLAAAHERGVIHRDIKPGNVWLEARSPGTAAPGVSRVKILDFGLARAAEATDSISHSGAIVGTPAYMAPEQARGENIDARADLFSLGCILYEMTTGTRPFHGWGHVVVLRALEMKQPTPPAGDTPPELSALVMRLLSKDPAGRPAGAAEVAAALREMEAERAAPAAGPVARRTQPSSRSRPALLAAAAIALVLIGGPLGYYAFVFLRGAPEPVVSGLTTVPAPPEAKKDADENIPEGYPDELLHRKAGVRVALMRDDFEPVWHRRLFGEGKFMRTQFQLFLTGPRDKGPTLLALDDDPKGRDFEFAIDLNAPVTRPGDNRYGVFFGWRENAKPFFWLEMHEHASPTQPHGVLQIGVMRLIKGNEAEMEFNAFKAFWPPNHAIPLAKSKAWHHLVVRADKEAIKITIDDQPPLTVTFEWLAKSEIGIPPPKDAHGALGVWSWNAYPGAFRNAFISGPLR